MSRINVEFIKRLNVLLVGKSSNLQNKLLLQSALDRPINYANYVPNPPASRLAAELSYGIIKNHCFMDGNKRTAFLAANEFLREKGHKAFLESDAEDVAKSSALKQALDNLGSIHEEVAGSTKEVEDLEKAYAAVIGE